MCIRSETSSDNGEVPDNQLGLSPTPPPKPKSMPEALALRSPRPVPGQ